MSLRSAGPSPGGTESAGTGGSVTARLAGLCPGGCWSMPGVARRRPGEGELDVVGLLRAVLRAGYVGPCCAEVDTPELCALAADKAAPSSGQCCRTPRRGWDAESDIHFQSGVTVVD